MSTKKIFASILLLAFTGCDDEEAPCTGHLCNEEVQISAPDGGNILFEYIYVDTELAAFFKLPAGVTTINRIIGYFTNSQTPNNAPLPAAGTCTNLVATKGWPMFVPPAGQHVDLDVGTVTITGKNSAGVEKTIDVPKAAAAGTDNIGRPHDLYYQQIQVPAADFIAHNAAYTVSFGGAGKIPATTFQDGLFMSERFEINNPGLEDNGPLLSTGDNTVHWTPSTSSNLPMGDEVLGVAWLTDASGSPTHICPTSLDAGQITIPGSAVAELKAINQSKGLPMNKGVLLRNAIVHHLRKLPNGEANNVRRIDMLTVNCWAQLMDLQ